MLQTLQIENYALIHSLEIGFDKGFTVITGETGAGKSILLGALSLILGSRAETDVLYDKQHKCIVEGTFDISELHLQSFFEENDLDYQDRTIIRREINEHGKSRAFINDTPVNLTTLKALTSQLIDIHSQHQNLLLQSTDFRIGLLDHYAHNQAILCDYKKTLAALRKAEQAYGKLKQQCTDEALQQEFNQFTVQELEQANLQPGEQEECEQSLQRLTHAEDIKAHLYQAAGLLSEQEEENILQMLKQVQHECATLKEISTEYREIHDRLGTVIVELKDIAYDIVTKEQSVELNPKEIERIEHRLDLIYGLEQKYQVSTIGELVDISNKLQRELSQHTDHKDQLLELEKECTRLRKETYLAAQRLSASRKAVIANFQQEMEQRLKRLAMPNSRFEVQMVQDEEYHLNGMDSVVFLFSANEGIAPADINKMASGGELSRLMLAMKSAVTDSTFLPTVIFDEIDTGISGETAHRVATAMGELSHRHQVIAITHLPQIAANSDRHYLVYKECSGNRTITQLRCLNDREHESTIAQLISGNTLSETALRTARELIHNRKS